MKYKYKKINGKNIAVHRIKFELHLGRKLTNEEVVHHIDGNPSNNDINNLMLFPTKKAHTQYHYERGDLALRAGNNKKKEIDGKFQCFVCEELKEKKEFLTDVKQYKGIRGICKLCYNKRRREKKS